MSDLVSKEMLLTKHPYYKVESYRIRLAKLNYVYFCYIKRDGNCFYNAFSASYFAKINKINNDYYVKLKDKMNAIMLKIKTMNENLMVFECFYETFLDSFEMQMNKVGDENKEETSDAIKDNDNDGHFDRDNSDVDAKTKNVIANNMCSSNSVGSNVYNPKYDSSNTISKDKEQDDKQKVKNDNTNCICNANNDITGQKKEHIDKHKANNDVKDAVLQLDNELLKYNDFIWDNPTKNNMSYNEFVGFYKVLISLHLKAKKDMYEPFVGDVVEYTKKRVEPFYVDASDVEINILSEVLEIGIKVVYIDQDFDVIFGDKTNYVTLLYTPGHFEPLFE
ncbi:OTU domain [Binucleata daphniae]